MTYPTKEEVERASKEQLAQWYRFLPSPGQNNIEKIDSEEEILNSILHRFSKLGGWTPSLSKKVGWENEY